MNKNDIISVGFRGLLTIYLSNIYLAASVTNNLSSSIVLIGSGLDIGLDAITLRLGGLGWDELSPLVLLPLDYMNRSKQDRKLEWNNETTW